MQHARRPFFQYVAFAIVIIPASLAAAALFGVVGAAWGMATGAGVGLVAAYLFYRRSLRGLAA